MTYQHPLALEDVVFDSMPEGDQEQEYPEENKQHVQLQERQNTILEVTKVESDEEEVRQYTESGIHTPSTKPTSREQ